MSGVTWIIIGFSVVSNPCKVSVSMVRCRRNFAFLLTDIGFVINFRIGTFVIMIYNLSFVADVDRLYLCEVRVPCEGRNNESEEDITANHKEKTSV